MLGFYYLSETRKPVTGLAMPREAFKIMDKVQHPRQIGEKYHGQGLIAYRLGNHKKAIDLFKKSIAQFESINDTISINRAKSALAHGFRALGTLTAAATEYKETIVAFQDSGQFPAVAHQLAGKLGQSSHYLDGDLACILLLCLGASGMDTPTTT